MTITPISRGARRRILGALVLLFAAAPLRAQTTIPDTPAGRRATALLETVRDASEERVRAFIAEQTDKGFQEIPLATHLERFRGMGRMVGSAAIAGVRAPSPTEVEVDFRGPQGAMTLLVGVEGAPPHRVVGLGLRPMAEPAPAGPLTDAGRAAVVDSAASLLNRFYVTRDTAEVIGARLRERLGAGAYAGMDRRAFAQALTADIRAVHPDQHLSVMPRSAAQGPRPGPAAGGNAAGAGQYRYLADARILPGNVGYLKMTSFPGAAEAYDELAAALRTMERTDAMVIDVRESRGGSADLANFLISHFTAPNLLSLATFEPASGDTTLRRTLAEVPGPRRVDVPLYVLVDRGSRSAAEDVPFVLRSLGRATLVGERTAGAGRNNRMFPLGEGLDISISITRVWDPCTGAEWERVGIAPDIAVPPAEALDAALRAPRRAPAALPQAGCRRAS
jgi:hypothetical protein